MPDKPFREMSNNELIAEFAKWSAKIESAKGWGAALGQAARWRDQIRRILKSRGAEIEFFDSIAEVELAILAGRVARPQTSINGKVIWAWKGTEE